MVSVTSRPAAGVDRRAEARERLLAATERLLADGAGFTELAVQRITAEAGVSRSSFYTHFPDKSALLAQLARTVRGHAARLSAAWQADDMSGLDSLVTLYEQVLGLYREHAAVVAAIIEAAAYDPEVRESWNAELDSVAARARDRLLRDQGGGWTTSGVDVDAAATVIVRGGFHAITHHLAVHDADRDPAFAAELARIAWFGAFRRPAD